MSKKWKIVLAIVLGVIIVGGGVYFWQVNKGPSNLQTTKSGDDKIFEGNGFSFTYPAEYVADSKGLWTAEGYQRHLNPPEACDTCQIPEVEIKVTSSDSTLDQRIISDYDLSGATLAEMSEQTGIQYTTVRIGNNDFVRIAVADMFDVTGYYTKHNNQIIAFRVYQDEKDNTMLREIISTLKFE